MKLPFKQQISLFLRDLVDFNALLDDKNKKLRTLVFYSEKDIYYQYYEGLIDSIIKKSELDICYISSDPDDPIFHAKNKRIKSFYIKNSLAYVISNLDAKVIIMTMPDLNLFYIKKSQKTKHYVYVFHGISSTHLGYRFGGLDHYDILLCVGPHQVEELRKAESLYGLKHRELVQCGYHRLEKIFKDHQKFLNETIPDVNTPKTILIAPTWGKNSIFETCIKEIITALAHTDYMVFVRPHPESIKRRMNMIHMLENELKGIENIKLELDLVSDINIHNADILITDTSAIALEYAFGTERPVIFINIPLKIENPRYEELGMEAIEVLLRDKIGINISTHEIYKLDKIIKEFIHEYPGYKEKIIKYRKKYIYNWMNSSSAGADYIINLCNS